MEVREKMNNVVYALLPFLLFGAILGLLLNERFSEKKTRVIYGAVFFFVFVFHLAFGLASFDNAFLLSLMPLTAYLPMIVLFYALSKRNFACNTFVVLLGIIASLIALLFKKRGRSLSFRHSEVWEFCPIFCYSRFVFWSASFWGGSSTGIRENSSAMKKSPINESLISTFSSFS